MALLLCAALFFVAFVLLMWQWAAQRRGRQLVAQRLQGTQVDEHRLGSLVQRMGNSGLGQRMFNLDGETRVLLDRVGWRRSRQRSLFAAIQVGVPLCGFVFGLVAQETFYRGAPPWVLPVLGMGVGYLLPKRTLAILVRRRQNEVAKEVLTFIPLLRILFESGLAVEQALRVLASEGRQLLPVLSEELQLVLLRVDSGLSLAHELEASAQVLGVDEYSDTCVILEQLLTQGGGAMKSLLALKQLLDDRRLTALQERVSKMSGKLSFVMMVFLFPALLIVLAGPGFTALARALGS